MVESREEHDDALVRRLGELYVKEQTDAYLDRKVKTLMTVVKYMTQVIVVLLGVFGILQYFSIERLGTL